MSQKKGREGGWHKKMKMGAIEKGDNSSGMVDA